MDLQDQYLYDRSLNIEKLLVLRIPSWKRLMDLFLVIVCVPIFSPIMLAAAIAIKLTSKGPVLFKQKRTGEGCRIFEFMKFRSMYYNCDQNVHQQHIERLSKRELDLNHNNRDNSCSYKLLDDERLTKIGKFLRRTSIDELPQLFNVLKGEMSFVGPRPYPVYQNESCTTWQRARLRVKPGITGLSQVYARYNMSYVDAYRLDLQYIKNHTLWLDLKILIKTLPIVISGRGAV